MLRTYASLRGIWRLITLFEDATGMRLSEKKTEGIRCGRLASKPIPQIEGLDITSIQWVKFGTYVRLLGIPFWESGSYDENVFFRALYDKCKSKIAAWSDH